MRNYIRAILYTSFVLLFVLVMSCTTQKRNAVAQYQQSGIDIKFTGEQVADTVFLTIAPIPTDTTLYLKDYIEAVRCGKTIAIPTNGKEVHISPDSTASVYNISLDFYMFPPVYMRSSEYACIEVKNLSPLKYDIIGLQYLEPIPHSEEFFNLKFDLSKLKRYHSTEEIFNANIERMSLLLDEIIADVNPETATYVISMLEPDIAAKMFYKLPYASKNTLYYSNAYALLNDGIRQATQTEDLESDIASMATVDFSINSLDGMSFDISDLQGKWVILDFWVSWCGPCRRGFDKMKKIYGENSDKLEVVGIACGDQTEVWKKLIKELELPWINLLAASPESQGGVVGGYPVPAYPTKIVVDPQGRMRDYIVGEDEEFYDKLIKMISQ